MGKIHTHYDNLKVARLAPQEVIRAAYKALSQKYHPDKNPGDEKASRIMAILNSAYGTLSDPQRRKEHDEWIAAEEWEIEWLESTRNEDSRNDKPRHDGPRHEGPQQAWGNEHVSEPSAPRRRRRDWKWWGGMVACLGLGWVGGVTMVAEPQLLSSLLASAWGGKSAQDSRGRPDAFKLRGDSRAKGDSDDAAQDAWAVARPYYPENSAPKPPPIKVVTLSQIVLPGAVADCDNEAQTLVAPNGEAWPVRSGYVDGFPVGNKGDDMQLTLDNASNASAVFIKLYDMERHSNVRYVFLQAHDRMVVDRLLTGKYEVRYQNIDLGANQSGCPRRKAGKAAELNLPAPAPAVGVDVSSSPLN